MKKIFLALVCIAASGTASEAQNKKVVSITIKGDTYTVSKDIPKEIDGRYLYEGKGAPIVELNTASGEGIFQTHGMPEEKIRIWVDCDEKGVTRKHYRSKQEEAEGRFGYTILFQYLEGDKKDEYDLMEVRVLPDIGRMQILGERFKAL